jgi:hypothetical protein
VENVSRGLAIVAFFALSGVAVADSGLPNPSLTPGAVASTEIAKVCATGYARRVRPVGNVWSRLRNQAYDEYGLKRGERSFIDAAGRRHPAYQIDHLIPIELGGAPADLHNLWPQPIAAAKQKDRVENELHALVCAGQMPIRDAQRAIARDWRTAVPSDRR